MELNFKHEAFIYFHEWNSKFFCRLKLHFVAFLALFNILYHCVTLVFKLSIELTIIHFTLSTFLEKFFWIFWKPDDTSTPTGSSKFAMNLKFHHGSHYVVYLWTTHTELLQILLVHRNIVPKWKLVYNFLLKYFYNLTSHIAKSVH